MTLSALPPVTTSSQQAPGRGFSSLGQEDFLRLLTTQLKQQDPLEPVDNQQMVAQLAQFSSLSAATKSNEQLDEISMKLDALIGLQAGQ